jgi:hypothetical protein
MNDMNVPGKVGRSIEKMIEYVMYLCRPDGSIPLMGDTDSGRVLRLSDLHVYDRRYLLSAGAVIFERADFKRISGRFHEESYLLLGLNSQESYNGIREQSPAAPSALYRQAGMAVFRKNWEPDSDYMVFRSGPGDVRKHVGFSHNHADYLSFEVYRKGKPRLVDPGTFLYGLDDEWRFYFRKSEAHNTVVINNRDHVNVTATRFGLPGMHLSNIHRYEANDLYGYIDASHTGYASPGIKHRRRMMYVYGCYICIMDEITGEGQHDITYCFNADAGTMAPERKPGGVSLSWSEDGYSMSIFPVNMPGASVRTSRGETSPVRGWASYRYGERHPATVVFIENRVILPVMMGVLIDLNDDVIELPAYGVLSDGCSVTVRSRKGTDEILFNRDNVTLTRT